MNKGRILQYQKFKGVIASLLKTCTRDRLWPFFWIRWEPTVQNFNWMWNIFVSVSKSLKKHYLLGILLMYFVSKHSTKVQKSITRLFAQKSSSGPWLHGVPIACIKSSNMMAASSLSIVMQPSTSTFLKTCHSLKTSSEENNVLLTGLSFSIIGYRILSNDSIFSSLLTIREIRRLML